ncbi:MAG: DUF131 domain-containing protein [Candidatus Thorarchaeota archaeon]
MQTLDLLQFIGWMLLIGGFALVVVALASAFLKRNSEWEGSTESKGVILIGPIPIVWGYGKKGWIIAGAVGLILLLIWFMLYL